MTRRRKLHIAVDLDGIVADLHKAWLDLYNAEHGHGTVVEDLKHWDMHANVQIGQEIYKYLEHPGLYLGLQPLPGALDSLAELHDEGHQIHIISAASKSEQTAADKLVWCREHLPFVRRQFLTISHQKHRFVSDVFIDDSPNNIRQHARDQPGGVRLGIAWPYNEEVKDLMNLRAESYQDTRMAWAQMVDFIDAMARQAS